MRFCPFRRARCVEAQSAELPAPSSTARKDGWLDVRRFYIRALRSQTRFVILFFALWEAMDKSPMNLVYAGRHGFPEATADDYGVSLASLILHRC